MQTIFKSNNNFKDIFHDKSAQIRFLKKKLGVKTMRIMHMSL